MATMSFEHLLDILFVPICIQIGALIVGSFLSRLINRYLQSNVNRDSWQYIFVNALKGLPISWCSGVGLYWTINSLSIPETISRLLSYLLFAVIIFTLTRVIARTLSGMIDFYTMRSDQNMPKTSLLNNLINNEAKVQAIINKFSTNSPFSAKDFIEVSKSTGVPIELLLAQGIQESNLGTKGMAVRTKNIGNVGNNGNTGKTTYHNNWIDGLYKQANLLKTDYIANSYEDIDRLLNTNFLRPKKGGRYAEENNYAHAISKRLNEISESL